jgi:hypothetical protein
VKGEGARAGPPDDRRCTAQRSDGSGRCGRWAVRGGTVCVRHGAGSVSVRAAALTRWTREKLAGRIDALVAEVADTEPRHPIENLLEAGQRSTNMARFFERMVGMLTAGKWTNEDTEAIGALLGPDHTGDLAPHALLRLLKEWTDLQARTAKMALDANVDERRLRLTEALQTRLYDALGKAMTKAGIAGPQAERFRAALGDELRVREAVVMPIAPPPRADMA